MGIPRGYKKTSDDMKFYYSSPVKFTETECQNLINEIISDKWNSLEEDNKFLVSLYKRLYELGIIPEEVNI